MSDSPLLTTAERWRRYQRDLKAYRRRSLFRRSHPRFHRDLAILPHRFLARDRVRMAPLLVPAGQLQEELKGRAIWTLDTAARLVTGHGFLVAHDLTGYLDPETLETLIAEGRVGRPEQAGLSVDPLYVRPPMLIAHNPDEPIPFIELASGDRVVPWDFLMRDLMGTLGWRPDLLNRLEASYPGELQRKLRPTG
jgi:hypothetical protein